MSKSKLARIEKVIKELREVGFTVEGLQFWINCNRPGKVQKGKKIFIAGDIEKNPDEAELEFSIREDHLKEMFPSVEVVNTFKLPHKNGSDRARCLKEDISTLTTCTHIYLVEGWENSSASLLAWLNAKELGLTIIKE